MPAEDPGLSADIVPTAWPALAGAVVSAVLGALFAGADTALTSLTSTRLEALIDQANPGDKQAYERIQRDDAKLRSRYLLGRVASTAVTGVCLLVFLEPIAGKLSAWIALAFTIVVNAGLFEISTTLARKHADFSALIAARWFRPLEMAMIPLAMPLGWVGARLGRRDGEPPAADPKVAEAEVEALVDEGERSGVLAAEPAEMIRNVLDFAERTAKDAMVPRELLEAIEVETPLAEVLHTVAHSGHSRYPVYKDQLDNIVGLLYAKDLFKAAHFDEDAPASTLGDPGYPAPRSVKRVEDLLRTPANFVAESQPLSSLLREMRQRRQHLAIVVDEFGSVSGIVTMEDVLEEIVGDIRDEHDVPIEDLGDGRVVADATVSMKELCTYLGADAGALREDESLGRMLTEHLGKIPEVGTAFSKFGLRFVVRDPDEKRVGKVEVARV
jgi:CBS domain containing-hemolysin-like protein